MGIARRWSSVWPTALAHALSIIIFGLVMYNEHEKAGTTCCAWKSPGLHPVLMVFAFVWVGPWASMSYASLEWLFGVSHADAKKVHLGLQTLALVVAWLGFCTKYQGSAAHFRSIHSLVGMLVLAGYTAQWMVGAAVFVPPGLDPALKKMVHGWHGPIGLTLLVLSLGTVVTGVLTYAGKTSDASYDSKNYNRLTAAGFLTVPLGCLVAYVVSSRKRLLAREADGRERASLLTSTGNKQGWP